MINKEYNTENGLMSRETFNKLAETHYPNCISIYIPTERAGESVDAGEGQIHLKNSLKDVNKILVDKGLNSKERGDILDPVEMLLEDNQFWRNQSDGLAIYAHSEGMEYYTLPVQFRPQTYVSNHFYMLPVISYFNDDGKYYLLSLSAKQVRLYECKRDSIVEIEISDLAPDRIEDAVGYDFEEKTLQNRTGQGSKGGAMYHGHGSGKDDQKTELEKYFRAIDEGIMKLIDNENTPLVLACVDEHYPIYQKVTNYKHLYSEHVSGNPDEIEELMLQEESWDLVEGLFRKTRDIKSVEIRNHLARKKASTDIREIIPATVDGRVDTLFIEEGKDLLGIYDQTKRTI